MTQALNNDNVIKVKMLGGFSLSYNGVTIGDHENRTRKVWMLIEYLIANRDVTISQEALFNAVWAEEDEIGDQNNALKNLAYRARKTLQQLGYQDAELIVFHRDTYAWNKNVLIETDIDTFETLATKTEGDDQSKMLDMKKALSLYKGEFLPKSSSCGWVLLKSAYYMTLYVKVIIKFSDLLFKQQNFVEIIKICEKALQLYPLEEEIHKILLIAYINNGENNKALNHYSKTADILYKELGVSVSNSIKELYPKIVDSISEVQTDITIIKENLQEAATSKGAYFCAYEVFKNLYRAQARSIKRTENNVQFGLVTLIDKQNAQSARKNKEAMNKLKEAIIVSLRSGDVVASYSPLQFVLLLSNIEYESIEIISKRMKQNFKRLYRKNDMEINITIRTVTPFENK